MSNNLQNKMFAYCAGVMIILRMRNNLSSGVYRHHKGKYYRLITVCDLRKTQEPHVVYQELHGDCRVWLRPLDEFVARFQFVPDNELTVSIDKVGLLFIRDRKVLMTRTKGHTTPLQPGGKRDGDETDLQCLSREIKEELGCELDVNSAQLFGVYYAQAWNKPDGAMIRMPMYFANLLGEPKANAEIEEILWYSYKNRDTIPNAAKLIFDDLHSRGLID